MTHNELLAKIGNPIDEGYEYGDIVFNKALRVVVELHKPEQEIGGECDENGEELWVCTHCPDGDGFQDYPCPTIQAIEKELS